MLTIGQVRKTLKDNGKEYTDEQIIEIRDGFRDLAEIIFEKWQQDRLKKHNKKLCQEKGH